MVNKYLFILLISYLLFDFIPAVKAQDTLKNNRSYYRFTITGGFGNGYSQETNDIGIGFGLEFETQRKQHLFNIGIHQLEQFEILGISIPNLSVISFDVMYGKILSDKKLYSSINIGIGYLQKISHGELISYDHGIFGNEYYQKIKEYRFGIPISLKFFGVPKSYFGMGVNFYANINKHSFYIITSGFQFGKLRDKKIKIVN